MGLFNSHQETVFVMNSNHFIAMYFHDIDSLCLALIFRLCLDLLFLF